MAEKTRESKWNAASLKIKRISDISTSIRQAHIEANQNPQDLQNLKHYATMLKALYFEIFVHADEETQEEVDRKFNQFDKYFDSGSVPNTLLEKLEEMDRTLKELQFQASLELPTEENFDPETAAVDGLR